MKIIFQSHNTKNTYCNLNLPKAFEAFRQITNVAFQAPPRKHPPLRRQDFLENSQLIKCKSETKKTLSPEARLPRKSFSKGCHEDFVGTSNFISKTTLPPLPFNRHVSKFQTVLTPLKKKKKSPRKQIRGALPGPKTCKTQAFGALAAPGVSL